MMVDSDNGSMFRYSLQRQYREGIMTVFDRAKERLHWENVLWDRNWKMEEVWDDDTVKDWNHVQVDWGMAIEHEGMNTFHDTQSVCFLRKMVWGMIKHGIGS